MYTNIYVHKYAYSHLIYTIFYVHIRYIYISTDIYLISRYHLRRIKGIAILLMTKEALIRTVGEHNLKPLLAAHKRSIDWWSFWEISQLYPRRICMISLLLTLTLGFALDSCDNKDIILILGYNYSLSAYNDK